MKILGVAFEVDPSLTSGQLTELIRTGTFTLVQCAAVAIAWIEAIDRRPEGKKK